MENILNNINKRCVSISDAERKRSNAILHRVIDIIIKELKTDKLFESLFEKCFYGGSYYDGLKVSNPTEFDIDLLFVLPEICKPNVIATKKPGFVHVIIADPNNLGEKYKGLEQILDKQTNHISAKKILSWVESLLTKSFNKICPPGTPLTNIDVEGKPCSIHVKPVKSGPAFNMKIVAETNSDKIEIDVDLVPTFQFSKSCWPSVSAGYRQLSPTKHGKKDTFLAVPKSPTDIPNPDFHWRLSFQEQERELINGQELGRLKPALKLIKKLRDHWKHIIASYYIKTVFLWEVEKKPRDFWNKPLSFVFVEMLKIYGEKLESGSIEYYWNKNYNLIYSLKKSTLDGIANKIKNIVSEIDRMSEVDPFVVAKNLVPPEELDLIRNEVDIGKKTPKAIVSNNSVSSTQVSSSSKVFIQQSTSSANEFNHDLNLNKLKSNKDFQRMIEEIVDRRLKEVLRNYNIDKSASDPPKKTTSCDKFMETFRSCMEMNLTLTEKNNALERELNNLKIENAQLKGEASLIDF